MSKPYLTTGRKTTGGVYPRLPIETLQSSQPEQFTLFILAFLAIQNRTDALKKVVDLGSLTPSEATRLAINPGTSRLPNSYLEIAGIHGLPYEEYSGDPASGDEKSSGYSATQKEGSEPAPDRAGGYCNHGVVHFPTWHRLYVLLIEQAIGDAAEVIANALTKGFPNQRETWNKAATELRFPYWDWAAEDVAIQGLPLVLYSEKVSISLPSGIKQAIDNPLAYYPYDGGKVPSGALDEHVVPGATAFFSKWKRSYRHADSSPTPSGDNIERLNRVLRDSARDVRDKVARLFTFDESVDPARGWDEFSNRTAESLKKEEFYNTGSLEGVHETVHLILGGNGHMSDPDYTAFDPIFWFHHSNVDRLFSLWEYCYKDCWMGDGYVRDNQKYPWTQSVGADLKDGWELPNNPLAPFRTREGEYWTSEQTRFLDESAYPKYYTYQEVAGVKIEEDASPEQRVAARAALQRYYGLQPFNTAESLVALAPNLFRTPSAPVPDGQVAIPNYREFVVVAKLPEHAFNGSYSFTLYRKSGETHKDEIIGSVSVFARPDHSACAGCIKRRDAGTIVRGVIPIPRTMVASIVQSRGFQGREVGEDELIEEIRRGLTGVLVDARGSELAKAQNGEWLESLLETRAIPRHIAPQKIVLLSAAVSHPGNQMDGPVSFFDWKHHGDIFSGGWRKCGAPIRRSRGPTAASCLDAVACVIA
ncbi:hypothetical protein JAAARDRAFT_39428 [Jaapia argillacea MUCL 33604]|uniref:tyrosinase n=1 Tax=Jaapia argillacea MUCL 33604 TaxID=933084 RepID=A0A067PHP8_9AGAM|nr:hypothetical protein JAAARDRAFT_39428 [Jaapia argillacea MUCL 33604]